MSKRANPTLIGSFVLVALAIGIAVVVYLGSGRYGGDWYRFAIYFQGSAAGLQVGAPVVLKGVTIGKVNSIQVGFYPEDEDFIVPVVIEIDGQKILWTEQIGDIDGTSVLSKLIEQGLRARLGLQSVVTGQLRVELGFFPGTEVAFRGKNTKLPEIPSIPSTLDALIKVLADVPVQDLAASSLRIVQGMDKLVNSPQLAAILANLESLTGTLDKRSGPLADSLQQILIELHDLVGRIGRVVEHQSSNLDDVSTAAREFMHKLDSQITPTLGDVRSAADATERAFERVGKSVTAVDELVGADSPLRHELLKLLKDLSDAARSLRIMADYLERHPDALLRGKRQ
ncbi:MAG: MCE family protein [Gammaproteobacteria bacterium]|nr:MCE family protein [Gammaproteobacteria bacterium]